MNLNSGFSVLANAFWSQDISWLEFNVTVKMILLSFFIAMLSFNIKFYMKTWFWVSISVLTTLESNLNLTHPVCEYIQS